MWCARRHRPFRLIEDPELCEILHMLYDKVDIPSWWTISRDIHLLHVDARTRVVIYLLVRFLKNLKDCMLTWALTRHSAARFIFVLMDGLRRTSSHSSESRRTGFSMAESIISYLISFGMFLFPCPAVVRYHTDAWRTRQPRQRAHGRVSRREDGTMPHRVRH